MSLTNKDKENKNLPLKTPKKELPPWIVFAISGLGGATGWLPIHPLDVTKVRLQVNEKAGHKMTMSTTMKSIIQTEGFFGLYSGLSAGLTRQLTYTTLRLGIYQVLRDNVHDYLKEQQREINFLHKLGIGLTAGAIAAGMCNPVEVALVRMQADGAQTDPKMKRNYRHVFDAIYRVAKEEQLKTLWRGAKPTIARGMVVNCVQLASYDQAKHLLKQLNIIPDGPPLHLSASIISGFLYSVASLPMDICKTRMQNQPSADKTGGQLLYRSIPQTMVKIVSNEGLFALWKGFLPYFARSGGHTVTMFLCVEQYTKFFNSLYEVEKS